MDNVEEIKKRLDIVDFISQYLELKKTGINHSARCPFHAEKTASFMVSPERQSFRCFGCGEHGDVISFFMKIEGLSFPEALRILGERVGVQVEFKNKEQFEKQKSQKDQLYKINLLSAKFFKAALWSSQGELALKYLNDRGLTKPTLEKMKVGYAPAGNQLEQYFRKYKFSYDEVSLAGHPERFRYRIMFPIFDTFSQVIGFSGRILEEGLPEGVSPHPKYLNTPETPVFHKSKALYGLNVAKESIRLTKQAIIVEGQMDVCLSQEAGVENVVASSGTALTQEHLKILSRYTPNIVFSFDEDEAGQKAAHTAVQMALLEGLEPHLTTIEKYKDVGELVLADKGMWPEIVKKALPPVEWLVERKKKSLAGKEMTAQDKKELAKEALSFVARMQDEVEKEHYIQYVARAVGVPPITIEKAMSQVKVKTTIAEEGKTDKKDFEGEFLAYLLNFPKEAAKLKVDLVFDLEDSTYDEIYKQVKICYNTDKEIEKHLKELEAGLPREMREKFNSLVLVWDNIDDEASLRQVEFVALAAKLKSRQTEDVKKDFAQKISEADGRGDLEEVKRLMQELQKKI